MPISGAMNAKKMRRAMGTGANKQVSKPIDEKKELQKLKKEIRDKKILEKKL